MKKILTLVTPDEADTAETTAPEQAELIGTDSGDHLYESIKRAKGKYSVLTDCDTECELTDELFAALSEQSADVVLFDGGYCFKTTLLKGVPVKNCADKFRAEAYAAFSAKSVSKLAFRPFAFTAHVPVYSEADEAALSEVLEEFAKIKAKLAKDIYSFAFELVSDKIIAFYISAILAINSGALAPERLAEFDAKLKENVVLYLSIDKRFEATGLKLKKIREKNYKISFLAAGKLRKYALKKGRL